MQIKTKNKNKPSEHLLFLEVEGIDNFSLSLFKTLEVEGDDVIVFSNASLIRFR